MVVHFDGAVSGDPAASPQVTGKEGVLPGVKVMAVVVSLWAPWCSQFAPVAALSGVSMEPPLLARPQVAAWLKIMWAPAGASSSGRSGRAARGECMVWWMGDGDRLAV